MCFSRILGIDGERAEAGQPVTAEVISAQQETWIRPNMPADRTAILHVGTYKTGSSSIQNLLYKNRDLLATRHPARPTPEQYSLFRDYIDVRHGDGGMADMTALDFAAMVDDNFVDSRLVEYRLPGVHGGPGSLIAAVLIDILGDGISMIYSFYEPDLARRSLGTFMILDNMARVKRLGLPFLYLGYWVKGSGKMDYKARFLPQERLSTDGWVLHKGPPEDAQNHWN